MEWKLKTFEELTKEELYAILELRTKVFVVEQDCPYQECDGKDQDSYHLFLNKSGSIVAYLRILKPGVSYKEVSIGRVVVDKEFRETGIGKQMMKKAVEYITKLMKHRKIRISAQTYLKNFYTDLGFQQVSDEYLEDNIPHMEMVYGE